MSRRAESFANKLKTLVTTNYPQVDFNVAFKTPNQIDRYFPFKDNVKSNNRRSMVVYKIKCGHINCGASYIGKTECILELSIREHKKGTYSVCHQHEESNPGHQMNYDEFEVIDTADSD